MDMYVGIFTNVLYNSQKVDLKFFLTHAVLRKAEINIFLDLETCFSFSESPTGRPIKKI